ncbi:MAG: DUF2809 domain-containing protein [Bacteroidota bacterium]|nr:DUF2809 domain-containing protein [Bacteroidota bacterium]
MVSLAGFYKNYFLCFLLLFALEFIIGTSIHDQIIRPYGGDFLVVILIYCLVKSFVNGPVLKTACCVLVFAYLVELSQYYHLVAILGLQHSKVARIILGTQFSKADLFAYTLGILLALFIENVKRCLKNF